VEPVGGLHNRPGLARRARELGARMARKHGALACVVFAVESEAVDAHAGSVVARAVRVCDVVGTLGQREIAVLAPGTDHAGALQLAVRIGGTFRTSVAALPVAAGYDAVANLTYSPIDPVELLTRAAAAVRSGTAEPAHRWVRRFDVARSSGPKGATPPPGVPVGPTSDPRRTEA
jgi:hypothetical protein